MEMVGVAENVVAIIGNSMANWKTILTTGGNVLGEVNMKRGIFQGDSLSPLLFVIIMLPLTLILRKISLAVHGRSETFKQEQRISWNP